MLSQIGFVWRYWQQTPHDWDKQLCERYYIKNNTNETIRLKEHFISLKGSTLGNPVAFDVVVAAGTTVVCNLDIPDEMIKEFEKVKSGNSFVVNEELTILMQARVLRPKWTHEAALELKEML